MKGKCPQGMAFVTVVQYPSPFMKRLKNTAQQFKIRNEQPMHSSMDIETTGNVNETAFNSSGHFPDVVFEDAQSSVHMSEKLIREKQWQNALDMCKNQVRKYFFLIQKFLCCIRNLAW